MLFRSHISWSNLKSYAREHFHMEVFSHKKHSSVEQNLDGAENCFFLENPIHHNTVEEYYQFFHMLIKMEIDNDVKEFRYSVQSSWF